VPALGQPGARPARVTVAAGLVLAVAALALLNGGVRWSVERGLSFTTVPWNVGYFNYVVEALLFGALAVGLLRRVRGAWLGAVIPGGLFTVLGLLGLLELEVLRHLPGNLGSTAERWTWTEPRWYFPFAYATAILGLALGLAVVVLLTRRPAVEWLKALRAAD
jgi:hypothetical protein